MEVQSCSNLSHERHKAQEGSLDSRRAVTSCTSSYAGDVVDATLDDSIASLIVDACVDSPGGRAASTAGERPVTARAERRGGTDRERDPSSLSARPVPLAVYTEDSMSSLFFGGGSDAAGGGAEDEAESGGRDYSVDDLLMRQHEERRHKALNAAWDAQREKSVHAARTFYKASVQRLMEEGDTRKHYPAPGAEAFDGHAEAAGLEARDRRRVAVYNLQRAAQAKRGADEAMTQVSREVQRRVDTAAGARLDLPASASEAAAAAERLCVQRAAELDAARDVCRTLSLSDAEIGTLERCVPETAVAEAKASVSASLFARVAQANAEPSVEGAGRDHVASVYRCGVEAASGLDAAVADVAERILPELAKDVHANRKTLDTARQLSTQMEEFTKHPNPNHPDFFENLRGHRDAAREVAKRTEEGVARAEAAVAGLEKVIAHAKSHVPQLHQYMAETKGQAYQDQLAAGHVSTLSEDVRADAFRVYREAFKAEMDEVRQGYFRQANAALVEEKAKMNSEAAALRSRMEAAEAAADAAAKARLKPVIDENVYMRNLLAEVGFDVSKLVDGAANSKGTYLTIDDDAETLLENLKKAVEVHEKKREDIDKQKRELEETLAFEKTKLAAEETELRWKQAELERTMDENERRLAETKAKIEAEAVEARAARLRITEEAVKEGMAIAAKAAEEARAEVHSEVSAMSEKMAALETERDAARRDAEKASLAFEHDKMVYAKEMRGMKEDLKNQTEKVGSFLDILLQEAFLSELGGDANAEHFKLLGEYAVPGEGEIEFMSDKERAFTVLKSVIKGVEKSVNNGRNEAIMLVPKSKHEAREREYADNLRRMEEATQSLQKTLEEQLAAEAARRVEAESLLTETMDAVKEAEEAKLELRRSMARAEERHASQMSAFRAETLENSERVVSGRTANLQDECDRLNGEIAKLKDQLEDARTLLAETTAKLSDAQDAAAVVEGAKAAADEELATTRERSGRFQAEVEKELRREKVDKELLEHKVAELEEEVRNAKQQTVRELQKKRDAEAERDAQASAARNSFAEARALEKEKARLERLVNGEVPEEDFEADPDGASLATDAVAEFNAKVANMPHADLVKLLRGNHVEHVRVRRELARATEALENGLDAPQIALRKELRAAQEKAEALETELKTWKANQPRFMAMEAERDHMKAQLAKAVLLQKKAEDEAWEAKAFATQQYVEKSKYAREVETAGAEKRLMGVLATGAFEDAKKEHRAALDARTRAESLERVQTEAMARVKEEREKREAAMIKMAEMERELQAERAKVNTIRQDMQRYVDAATEEVHLAQQAHKQALKIATHAASDAVVAKAAFDSERAAALTAYERERSVQQMAAREIAHERARAAEMVTARYLAQHDVGDASRPAGALEGPAEHLSAAMAAATAKEAARHGMGHSTGAGVGADPVASAAAVARAAGRDPAAAALAVAAEGMAHRVDEVSTALRRAERAAAVGDHAAAFAPAPFGESRSLDATGQLAARRARERMATGDGDDWAEARREVARRNTSHQQRLDGQMAIMRNQIPGGASGGSVPDRGGARSTEAMKQQTLAEHREKQAAAQASSSWFPSFW